MNSMSDYLMIWRSWREAMDLNRRITFDFCLQTILFVTFFLVLEMLLASLLAAGILAVGVLLLVGLLIGLIRGVSQQGIAVSFLGLMYLSLGAMVVLSGGHSVAALIVLPVFMFMVVLLLTGQQVTWIWAALILPIPLFAMILLQMPAEYPIRFPPEWRQTSILGMSLLLVLYVQLVGRAYRASIDEAGREVD